MSGSGLKDLWSLIYAVDSIDKILTGHAYARALHAHLLTQATIAVIFLNEIEMDESSCKQLANLHGMVINETKSLEDISESSIRTTGHIDIRICTC